MAEVLEHTLPMKHKLTDLADVKVSSPLDGQVFKYIAADKKWENKALVLAALADVLISSPADGQVLTYVGADSKWENKTPTGGAAHKIREVLGTTDQSTSSNVWVDMPDMTITDTFGANHVLAFFMANYYHSITGHIGRAAIVLDGSIVAGNSHYCGLTGSAAYEEYGVPIFYHTVLNAGSHTFKVQWAVDSGSLTITNYASSLPWTARRLLLVELLS
jgi:hypothetical protein